MTARNKLRLAVSDRAGALEAVRSELQESTGWLVLPELQESERGSLIIEVRVIEPSEPDSQGLVRALDRTNRGIDILSAWREVPTSLRVPRPPSHAVLATTAGKLPGVAQRAIDDGVPTATWVAAGSVGRSERPSEWVLAVPVARASGDNVVGISRRSGYSHRFASTDADAIRFELAS